MNAILLSLVLTQSMQFNFDPQGGRVDIRGPAPEVQTQAVVTEETSGDGYRLSYRTSDDEDALYAFVRKTAKAGDVYLLPVQFPAVGTGRGAVSNTFTPPPRPKPESNQIPVDLLRFRLHTGTPIYVDFKSVPYADAEVLEWYRRMRQVQEWYTSPDWDSLAVRESLRREGITHVVAPRGRELHASYLKGVHADPAYVVYRVR